jgi:aryl-alcohol dehydrogenase-like predicted oxidoreductase
MQNRAFGPDGTRLPLLGLGCSRIGSFNNKVPMPEIRRTLERAMELGVTLFDTADVYGQGDSEREIGKFLAGRREKAFVVTKVGKLFSTKMRLMRPFKPILKPLLARSKGGREAVTGRRDANMATDFSPRHIIAAVDSSLKRLRFEHVDGLLLHSPPAEAAGSLAAGETMAALKRAGKVRHFGISCDDMASLEAALGVPGVDLLELPLDVIDAAEASGLSKAIAQRSIGVLAREVIRFQPTLAPSDAVARAAGREGVTSVILGTSRIPHLEEAVAAVNRA